MNELIKNDNDRITVSARELYKNLGATERFANWFDRMSQYGMEEGTDFTSVKNFTVVNNGATRELQDYQLTLNAAKEICMLQRNDAGKKFRQYFIEVEKEWNTPENVMSRALLMAQKKLESINQQVTVMKPKALFADAVAASDDTCLIRELAKILKGNGIGMGEKRLFTWLRANGYLVKRNGCDYNSPTQKSMDLGLFKVKETAITKPDGTTFVTRTTKVTGKGQQYFVNKFMNMYESERS